jgi:16S rRNA (guanine527-N7)-methyltransferase
MMHQAYRHRLARRCEQRGLWLSAAQLDLLLHYVDLLLYWRRHMNLTGLRQPERIVDVLVAESLDFLQREFLPPAARVLDLGTGAGVPGVPLAICAPDVQMTLLDRSEKKVTFLRHVVARLPLPNCVPWCESAETAARTLVPAAHFDVVVTRGVGPIREVMALAAPLVRPGGTLLLRKPEGSGEIGEAVANLDDECWTGVRTMPGWSPGRPQWVLVAVSRAAQQTA